MPDDVGRSLEGVDRPKDRRDVVLAALAVFQGQQGPAHDVEKVGRLRHEIGEGIVALGAGVAHPSRHWPSALVGELEADQTRRQLVGDAGQLLHDLPAVERALLGLHGDGGAGLDRPRHVAPAPPAGAASMAALRARRFVWPAMSSMVVTISEISSERSPRLLIFLAMVCTSVRVRCIPARLSRTASSPRCAASSAWWAARAEASAISATCRTERVSSSTAPLTVITSCTWAWAPTVMCPLALIIWLALDAARRAAWRTPSMTVPISATITLMASTTLPRTSAVTSPRLVRSPAEISSTMWRK